MGRTGPVAVIEASARRLAAVSFQLMITTAITRSHFVEDDAQQMHTEQIELSPYLSVRRRRLLVGASDVDGTVRHASHRKRDAARTTRWEIDDKCRTTVTGPMKQRLGR